VCASCPCGLQRQTWALLLLLLFRRLVLVRFGARRCFGFGFVPGSVPGSVPRSVVVVVAVVVAAVVPAPKNPRRGVDLSLQSPVVVGPPDADTGIVPAAGQVGSGGIKGDTLDGGGVDALPQNLVGMAQHVVVIVLVGVSAILGGSQVVKLPHRNGGVGIQRAAHQVGIPGSPGQSDGVQSVAPAQLDADPVLQIMMVGLEVAPGHQRVASALFCVDADHRVVPGAGQVLAVVGKPDRQYGRAGVGRQRAEKPVVAVIARQWSSGSRGIRRSSIVAVVVVVVAVGSSRPKFRMRMRMRMWMRMRM